MGEQKTPGQDVATSVERSVAEPAPVSTLIDSAPRRTWLAAERTYLAWLRTGLGALGLALAVGRLLPALIDASHVTFGLLGVGYGVLGIFLLIMAACRAQRTRRALSAQRPLPTDFWAVWVLTAASMALAVATIVLVAGEV
jgi:putative membrane protein